MIVPIPIPDPKWLFEQLLKLIGIEHEMSKERFEKVFEPIYLDMIKIDKDYNSMFDFVLNTIPRHIREENGFALITEFDNKLKPSEHLIKTEIKSEKYLNNLKVIKTILDNERKENQHLRVIARSISDKLIAKAKRYKERKFCWSVLNYFLDHTKFRDEKEEKAFFSRLIKHGHDATIDSPGYLLSEKIQESNDSIEIKNFILNKKLNFSDKFRDISSAYATLKIGTYK